MKFIRSLLLLCPAAVLLAQNPPPPEPTVTLSAENGPARPAVPPDKVVLTIGETKITAAQFDYIIDSLAEQYRPAARGPARKQFADNLARVLVMAAEAKRRKLNESPAFKARVDFAEATVLASLVYDDVNKSVKVDDAEVRKYYDAHKNELQEIRARHILIRAQGSPLPVKPGQKDLTEAEALAKVQELRKKLEGGADFAAIANAESDDTGSGSNGGDLGFFRHGQMVPSFEEAAFALKPGELSQPVKTQFGYHIIKMESEKGFDELKEDVEKKMRPETAQKTFEELQKKTAVVYDPEFFGAEKK
jgi:peptidyl-prolyl cis-trans isomerase C